MFDPELIEKRKAELERKKKEAAAKGKLPPLSGNHASQAESIPNSNLMDEDTLWLNYFLLSERTRNMCGVKTKEGKWEIVDRELFDKRVGELRKQLLKPYWKKQNER